MIMNTNEPRDDEREREQYIYICVCVFIKYSFICISMCSNHAKAYSFVHCQLCVCVYSYFNTIFTITKINYLYTITHNY